MSFRWCDVTVVLLQIAVRQVITSHKETESCYPDQCDFNEFCCNGLCCSYFGSNWYAWMVLVLLLVTVVVTCLCFPRFPWRQECEKPVPYHIFTSGTTRTDIPYTTPHKQQPHTPPYTSFATESFPIQQQHPYRYERLVQQSSAEITYPAPSAPPKTP